MLRSAIGGSGGHGARRAAGSGGVTGASRAGAVDGIEQAWSEAESRIGKAAFTGDLPDEKGLEGGAPGVEGCASPLIIGCGIRNGRRERLFAAPQVGPYRGEKAGVARIPLGHGAPIAAMIDPPERADHRERGEAMRREPDEPGRHQASPVRQTDRSAARRRTIPRTTRPPALFHSRKASQPPRQSPARKRRATVDRAKAGAPIL